MILKKWTVPIGKKKRVTLTIGLNSEAEHYFYHCMVEVNQRIVAAHHSTFDYEKEATQEGIKKAFSYLPWTFPSVCPSLSDEIRNLKNKIFNLELNAKDEVTVAAIKKIEQFVEAK
jgi:hypothetical protein